MVDRLSKRRLLLFRTIAATFALLVACLLAEVVVRLFLARHHDTELLRAQLARTSIKSLITLDPDPELLYVLRPDLAADFQESKVFTDAAGVRVSKPGGDTWTAAVRVALVGDSTAFGWRVDWDTTYAELLRRSLERSLGVTVAMRNFSVPGYNATQEYRVFERGVAAYAPHLLIVHHDHNDSQPAGWGYADWMPPEYGDNFLHSAFLKLVLRKLKTFFSRKEELPRGDNEYLEEYCVAGPLYDAMLASRQRLLEAARAQNIATVALIFNCNVAANPRFESTPVYERLHAALAGRLRAMGYSVLDTYPLYQRLLAETGQADMRNLWLDAGDQHPNRAGHEFLAQALAKFVEQAPELQKAMHR